MSTKIEWCDRSDWNPLVGCSKAGSACRHCYVLRRAVLLAHNPSVSEEVRLAYQKTINHVGGKWEWSGYPQWIADRLDKPLRWKQKKCECLHGQAIVQNKGEPFRQVVLCPHCNGTRKRPLRIFVNSMSDLFHESVPDEWIDKVFAVMAIARKHDFIVLTKRPERMCEYLSFTTGKGNVLSRVILEAQAMDKPGGPYLHDFGWPYRNIHLYVSVWDQPSADEFIPILLDTPAAVRGISIEPMLGPINLMPVMYEPTGKVWGKESTLQIEVRPAIDHVILGGETGPGARPMHSDWARSVRDQCQASAVPFFMKKMSGGNEPPDDLLVREMP